MTSDEARRREILEIVLAASAGDASDAQLARLSQLVVEDESLALYAVELWNQEAWLSWHGSQASAVGPAFCESSQPPAGLIQALRSEVGEGLVQLAADRGARRSGQQPRVGTRYAQWATHWGSTKLTTALLLGIGIVVGGVVMRWVDMSGQGRITAVGTISDDQEESRLQLPSSSYVARFVQSTACVWGPGGKPPKFEGGRMRGGESINLMEGLAEIELQLAPAGRTMLQVEGPARMVLTAEGTPSLMLGKFAADVKLGFGQFALETPFGQLVVAEDSSLGVAVYGTMVEVHVFDGQVVVVSPWTSDGTSVDRFSILGGQALRLHASESGVMDMTRNIAEPSRFASQVTMASDRLEVSDEYVEAIVRATPILYWRFDETRDGVVRNKMGDRFHGVVVGSPDWSLQGDNLAIELGTGLTDTTLQAYVESSEPVSGLISHSYSVESWIKPSHYHLGSLVSLLQNPGATDEPGRHGMLLELGGQLTTPTTIEHPGRIRFLHRNPPSDDAHAGTSCFSHSPYELRRWTHVVAVKDGPEMRLYVNGEQVASADANVALADDLTVLVGQLDWHRDWRRFVGQLDELAIYGRALSDREIQHHYQLVRPRKRTPGAI